MSSDDVAAISAFIEGAPPGELSDVVADINALTPDDRSLLESARPAFKKYNEEQLTTVKLPGSSRSVLVSSYNSLADDRYYDVESSSSFAFDHITQKASDVRSHNVESEHTSLMYGSQTESSVSQEPPRNANPLSPSSSLSKALSTHALEHYPSSASALVPTDSDSSIAILLVANKYSPSNFWNGRLRTLYTYDPSSSTLTGTLKCDVHYYEDGNVRLTTSKSIPSTNVSSSGPDIMRTIAKVEKAYQEELNRGFNRLSEGEFKSLRRQLPVTRQKVEWEKVGSYRAGKEIGGARR